MHPKFMDVDLQKNSKLLELLIHTRSWPLKTIVQSQNLGSMELFNPIDESIGMVPRCLKLIYDKFEWN